MGVTLSVLSPLLLLVVHKRPFGQLAFQARTESSAVLPCDAPRRCSTGFWPCECISSGTTVCEFVAPSAKKWLHAENAAAVAIRCVRKPPPHGGSGQASKVTSSSEACQEQAEGTRTQAVTHHQEALASIWCTRAISSPAHSRGVSHTLQTSLTYAFYISFW